MDTQPDCEFEGPIRTVTGEEVVLFTLAESPLVREVKKKSNS
jgi:hypothetical protein